MRRMLLAIGVIVAAATAALARPDTASAFCDDPTCIVFIYNHPALGGGGGRYYYM